MFEYIKNQSYFRFFTQKKCNIKVVVGKLAKVYSNKTFFAIYTFLIAKTIT